MELEMGTLPSRDQEFFSVALRKKVYGSLQELQEVLDA
jgi:hypothetical protein